MTRPTFTDEELEALLEAAKWGRVPEQKLSQLAQQLAEGRIPDSQQYTALHIVSRAGGRDHEELIRGFLDTESNPMLARLALQALCDWLELCDRYRDRLIEFIRWVPWDHSDDVRQMAIAMAGKRLGDTEDLELLALLLGTAENHAEMALTRDEAVRALARSLGDPPESLPPATAVQDPDSPWSQDVLERAHRRLDDNGGDSSDGG